jgi:hypothetical protein
MPLKRLTHERYRAMRSDGTFPGDAAGARAAAARHRSARAPRCESTHPGWFQVRALVRRGGAVDAVFLIEYPTLSRAILAASAYPYRALVIDRHSARQFDNGKPFEEE